jgi:hypothetical protein
MIQFRLYFDKDKETLWLNEMAAKGYAMTGFFAGFYTFEKCEPGEYTYQIDFGDKLFAVTDDYREFMTETGVEIVQTWGFWVILRKKTADGPFVLYTDVDSQITHYTKIRNMFKVGTIIELICFLIEIIAYYQVPAGDRGFNLFCTILVGIFVVVIMKAALSTNKIINELKERKGEVPCMKNNKVHPILLAGLLLNTCALIMDNPSLDVVKMIIHILAIILMLAGIYQTAHGTKQV